MGSGASFFPTTLITRLRTLAPDLKVGPTMARLLVFACALLTAVPALAQDVEEQAEAARFQFGPLRFTPSIAVSNIGVDSNVFNEVDDPKRDTTAAIGPAVNYWMHIGPSRLYGKASGQYLWFSEFDSQRAWNTTYEGKWELPLARIMPFVEGAYANTRERPGYEIDARARRRDDKIGIGTAVNVAGRTTLVVSASRSNVEFDEAETFLGAALALALNRRSDVEALHLRYELTPLTTFVVRAEAQQDRFEFGRIRNTDIVRVVPGFELAPSALISGKVFVGYQRLNALDPTLPDDQGVTAAVEARYVLTATQFEVRVQRDLAYSFEQTQPYYALLDLGLTVTQRITRTWDVIGRGGWQSLSYRKLAGAAAASDRVDTGTQLGAGIGYRLGETVRVGFDVNHFARQSEAVITRDYDGFRFGGSISYGLPQ